MTETNVDAREIAKFEALATTWWDPEGPSKPLHRINPLRLNYIMQLTDGLFGLNVLDVGCGGGILSESMALEGACVTGLDMSKKALHAAQLHAKENKVIINYQQDTVEHYAQQNASKFDIVSCMEMLEHVPDPESIIAACAKLVKPTGHVFLSTINRNKKAWFSLIMAAEYLTKTIPIGTHNANKFIRPAELIRWANQASLCEKHIIGLQYNPIQDQFKLSPNVEVNYILHLQPNG